MDNKIDNMTPDSLSGMIFGFEGIRRSLTLLNGPTGCKFYHSITVDNQSLRKDDMDPLNYPEEWFFGQGRVPCTYLDKRDYVYGSDGKLHDAISFILEKTSPEILIVVNSPGAALIGDDLEKIVRSALEDSGHADMPYITCQSPGFSKDVTDGYKYACETVLRKFAGPGKSEDSESGIAASGKSPLPFGENGQDGPSVNLLGLSIYHKYHAGDIKELTRLLGLMGVKVRSALLCESSIDDIRKTGDAGLNILIDPEYGLESAEYLKKEFGTPYVTLGKYPVGFNAAEEIVKLVAEHFDGAAGTSGGCADDAAKSDSESCGHGAIDHSAALEDIERARAAAYIHISRMSAVTGLPKGVKFQVLGSDSFRKGYSDFLTEHLGMIEDSEGPDIVLADGNTIAVMKAEGKRFTGIEISLPTIGYIDVIEKTHLGSNGALLLIEQILNGLVY